MVSRCCSGNNLYLQDDADDCCTDCSGSRKRDHDRVCMLCREGMIRDRITLFLAIVCIVLLALIVVDSCYDSFNDGDSDTVFVIVEEGGGYKIIEINDLDDSDVFFANVSDIEEFIPSDSEDGI